MLLGVYFYENIHDKITGKIIFLRNFYNKANSFTHEDNQTLNSF